MENRVRMSVHSFFAENGRLAGGHLVQHSRQKRKRIGANIHSSRAPAPGTYKAAVPMAEPGTVSDPPSKSSGCNIWRHQNPEPLACPR